MSFALKVTEISKSFPGVLANDKINIEIPKGTIHAIVGENGAGKSTLMKVIYGMISPDSGTITVEDEEKKFEKIIQDFTDKNIKIIDEKVVSKEKEIMTI